MTAKGRGNLAAGAHSPIGGRNRKHHTLIDEPVPGPAGPAPGPGPTTFLPTFLQGKKNGGPSGSGLVGSMLNGMESETINTADNFPRPRHTINSTGFIPSSGGAVAGRSGRNGGRDFGLGGMPTMTEPWDVDIEQQLLGSDFSMHLDMDEPADGRNGSTFLF